MAEAASTVKGTSRKSRQDSQSSRSSLHYGNTPVGTANTGRMSLMSSVRLQKLTSNSLEKLSFISEREDNDDFENYHFEYSTYLLRKVQSRLLIQNREQKEENVKRCLVSLKLEFQGLLGRYVKLSKEIGYYKIFFEILKETNKRIEAGNKLLKVFRETEFENFMKRLSDVLDETINQLRLVDIDKCLIEELFTKNVWGSGSEMEECLKSISGLISKNKCEVANIATELVNIKKLSLENGLLRERFCSAFDKISNEYLETNYNLFTKIVKKAFSQRQESKGSSTSNNLDCDLTEFLQSVTKTGNEQFSLQISKLNCSCPEAPKSASTPQHNA